MSEATAGDGVMNRYKNPVYKGDTGAFIAQSQEPEIATRVLVREGDNPFCGDAVTIALLCIEQNGREVILDARWDGYSCSLCAAAAEALLEQIIGRDIAEVAALEDADITAALGGITPSRTRMQCVHLPLAVMREALEDA
jgi:NifU-like protein involved in Fe-S cluster formation